MVINALNLDAGIGELAIIVAMIDIVNRRVVTIPRFRYVYYIYEYRRTLSRCVKDLHVCDCDFIDST